MQVGQSCIAHKKVFTNWDWSKDRDHPDLLKDAHGLGCLDPNNEATCPRSRMCSEDVAHLCHTDRPDWTKIEVINARWSEVMGQKITNPPYLDPSKKGGHSWAHLRSAIPGSHDDYTFDVEVEWGIAPSPP